MTLEYALKKASEILYLAAERQAKDKKAQAYTAAIHSEGVGYAMRVLFHPKDDAADRLEPSTKNFIAVFHALYNHSAWRQKFEKGKDATTPALFKKADKRDVTAVESELEEEFGE